MWLIRCANPTTQQLWKPPGGQFPPRRRTLNAVEYFRVGRKLSKAVLRFKKAFLRAKLSFFEGYGRTPYLSTYTSSLRGLRACARFGRARIASSSGEPREIAVRTSRPLGTPRIVLAVAGPLPVNQPML